MARRGAVLNKARGGAPLRLRGPIRLRTFSFSDYNSNFEDYYGNQLTAEYGTSRLYLSNGLEWKLVPATEHSLHAGSDVEVVTVLPSVVPASGTLVMLAKTLPEWAFEQPRKVPGGQNSKELREAAVLRGDIPPSEVGE